MATTTSLIPHKIFLAGRWVDSPDVLVVDNPARPGEPGKPPLGDASDAESLAQINAGIAELARRHGWGLVRVPELGPDHTYDGIHFMPPVQQRYVDLLSGEAGSEGLGGVSARR